MLTPRLAEMSWTDAAAAIESGATTVILPIGATEQHGPHLPLGTDTIRAAELADRLAGRLPGSLVAPALPFGCSDEHSGFAGLFGLAAETLAQVILALARRLMGWGVQRLVLLSAPGGNGEALDLALTLLHQELPDLEVHKNDNLEMLSRAILETARGNGIPASSVGLHAGESETSEMLHLRPDLVSARRTPGFAGDMEAVLDTLREGGLSAVTDNGILGNPTHASADRGNHYLAAFADELVATLRHDTNAS